MRWLVTGGAGFIGRNLLRLLLEQGRAAAIRVVDDLSAGGEETRPGEPFRGVSADAPGPLRDGAFEFVRADVRDREAMLRAAEGAEAVVHLAAATGVLPSIEDPFTDCSTNVLGTLAVLEGARRAGASGFVLASSGAPLGEQDPPLHENKVPRPISPYGASKLAGEAYCSAYHGSFGLATAALRFSNVYGPGSIHKGSVVAKFIRRALRGEPLTVYGEGEQTRDFVYVDDLVEAIARAGSLGLRGETLQIATGRETSVNELVGLLERVLRERGGVQVKIVHEPPIEGDVQRNYADISKARRLLDWEPRMALEEGLARTVDWFLALPRESL